MEPSLHAPKNVLERIFDLPAELRRPTLLYIWPVTLRIHYCEPFQGPRTCFEPAIRLTSTDTTSIMFPDYLFRLSDHMITRSWYKAMTEHLNTTTLWDLGDVEQLDTYYRQRMKQQQRPALHEAFLQRLKSVRHTSISLRPRSWSCDTADPNMLLRLPDFANGRLLLSTVRLYLVGLFELPSNTQDVWAVKITNFARVVNDTKTPVQEPRQVKIACSEEEFHSRSGQRFADVLRRHCGPDAVKWLPTITCRYQGRLGDLTVIWTGKESASIQDVF